MKISLDLCLTIGKYKQTYLIKNHFPLLTQEEKIVVFVSGGMESTLIAKICIELYSKENVILLYTDDLFANSKESKKIIKHNAENIEKLLDTKVEYFPISKSSHTIDGYNNSLNTRKTIIEKFNAKYGMIGFTDIFWKLEKLKQSELSNIEFRNIILSDQVYYKDLIEEIHLHTDSYEDHILNIDINPKTWEILKDPINTGLLSPFKDLNKHAIVDLYNQLGWYDILSQTRSCVDIDQETTGYHCGKCFNCQQRYDSFSMLGLVDPTKYLHDDISKKRQNLLQNKHLYEF